MTAAAYTSYMTDHGTHISVEAEEADLDQLLKTVAERHVPVRILSGGHAVAELSPVPDGRRRELACDPLLKVTFNTPSGGEDLMGEQDWPEHLLIDVDPSPPPPAEGGR